MYVNLINELINLGYLKTERVIEAFNLYDRALFIPEEKKKYSYKNVPIRVGDGGFIVQPLIAGIVIELLDLRPGNAVLEIGTSTGWQTTIIAKLIAHPGGINEDEDGRYGIVSYEKSDILKQRADEIFNSFNTVEKGIIKTVLGDGQKGDEERAPFDKIVCWYGIREIPSVWYEQLRIGGKMVVPTYTSIALYEKTDKNTFSHKEYFGYTTPHWHLE